MRRRLWLVASAVLVIIAISFAVRYLRHYKRAESGAAETVPNELAPPARAVEHVVVNEAARTLLYLPLYHAIERGFFRDNGIEVEIVTGGTATNSFAALLSGEAEFSQADPMYAAISREKGGRTKVIGQVVGRIGIWGVSKNPELHDMSRSSLKGRKISTHPRPMTAYTYTTKMIRDAGLSLGSDTEIIQSKPGTELLPVLKGEADFAVTVEPNVSTAEREGARVVQSFPRLFGEQVLTGFMTTEDFLNARPDTVLRVARAYQSALDDLHANPGSAVSSAAKYFPQLQREVLQSAVERMLKEEVVPRSITISEDSWITP